VGRPHTSHSGQLYQEQARTKSQLTATAGANPVTFSTLTHHSQPSPTPMRILCFYSETEEHSDFGLNDTNLHRYAKNKK
jgi:hypothetical protein